jgi:hypothetical protein
MFNRYPHVATPFYPPSKEEMRTELQLQTEEYFKKTRQVFWLKTIPIELRPAVPTTESVHQRIIRALTRRAMIPTDLEAGAMTLGSSPTTVEDNKPKLSLTEQVKECMVAGMSADDGHRYVGIYDEGYRVITKLINISENHEDPIIRAAARGFLSTIDTKGGLKRLFRKALRFVTKNIAPPTTPLHRRARSLGLRTVRDRDKSRMEMAVKRGDVSEDVKSELKRILASFVDRKLSAADFNKAMGLLRPYSRKRMTNGWRKVDSKTYSSPVDEQLRSLMNRTDVSDAVKRRASELLSSIVDGRMETKNHVEAIDLVTDNRFNKRVRAKRIELMETFENAVSMACQACDNLDGMEVPILSDEKRNNLVIRLSGSAADLLRLQSKLLREEEEDERRD